MTIAPPPTEWKSARWWQNRSTEERIAWSHMPPRWQNASLGQVPISDKTMSRVNQFIDTDGYPYGLFLHGPSGVGKTPLAVSIMRHLVMTKPLSARFITAERYVEMLKDQFDNDNELPEMYSMPHIVKYLKGVFDIVVLDAVGQERNTEFSQHEIGSLIRRRNEDCRRTIITTHLTPSEFIKRYGERVSAALGDMALAQVM